MTKNVYMTHKVLSANMGLQVLIVESYGGKDEPVDTLTNNFVGVGVEPALDAVRLREVPNEATYQVNAGLLLHFKCACMHII